MDNWYLMRKDKSQFYKAVQLLLIKVKLLQEIKNNHIKARLLLYQIIFKFLIDLIYIPLFLRHLILD